MLQLFPVPPVPETRWFHETVATLPRQEEKTIAITGCTSGTGRVLAHTCASLGARIVMLNRPSARADRALAELVDGGSDAVLVPCDLQDLSSVRAAGDALAAACPDGIDVLCNNAGVMGLPDQATGDGFDVQMQVNHLSHVELTARAWPLLEQAATARGEARVVNHSSGARLGAQLKPEYLGRNGGNLGGDGFPGLGRWLRYQQTKLANLLFTYALMDHVAAERPAFATAIKSVCAHPGATHTGLQQKTNQAGGRGLLDQFVIWRSMREGQSEEDGTLGILRASCDPEVETGDFFGPPRRNGPAGRLPPERDPEAEAVLWAESLRALGREGFFG